MKNFVILVVLLACAGMLLALPTGAQQGALQPANASASIAASVSAETTFVSDASQRPVLLALEGSADTAGNYVFRDGVGGPVKFTWWLPARSSSNKNETFTPIPSAGIQFTSTAVTVQGPTNSNATLNAAFKLVPK